MMLPGRPFWVDALLAAVLLTLTFGAGWAVNGWRHGVKLAELQQAQAEAQTKAANDNAARLAFAADVAGRLTLRLAAAENALTEITEEKDREIRRITTGRRCLDADAVGVLNRSGGTQLPRLAPETPGESVRANAAFATDTDVGTWIASAQRSYDTCRGRLDAIADFYKEQR